MELFLAGDPELARRSSWVVSHCAERHPDLVRPYVGRMIRKMQDPAMHDAVKRNMIRILQFVDLPEQLLGTVAAVCFENLTSARAPIAARVFSMTVLANIAVRKPDLKRELKLVIEQQLPYTTPAFQARARHVLRMLRTGVNKG